jgi:phosphate transport system permease protein
VSALRASLAEGTAQRWLTLAAVLLSLAMIGGLIVLVVQVSTAAFWPHQVVELELADGGRLLGEEAGRSDDPLSPGRERVRMKVGNRDLDPADFRWVRESQVTRRRVPADAWLLERREYGPFYGYARRLLLGDRAVEAAGGELRREFARALGESSRLVDEERRLFARVAALHEPVVRLDARIASARGRGKPVAELAARREAIAARERESSAPLLAELAALRQRLEQGALELETADGSLHAVPLGKIVRAVPVNDLSAGERLRLYVARWAEFIGGEPRESNTEGGIFPAIFGTALMVMLMTVLVVPFGVITAVYLNEYARDTLFTKAVRLALANLAGVPSIVFGAFGLAFFVWTLGGALDRLLFSDVLPTPTFGTGGILWASLTLALLTVPVVVVATEEGLQSVPQAVRDGARALGATRWQTLRRVVLPYALPGILTGTILAVARGAGEVAPLMLTGVVKLAPDLALDLEPPFLHLERKFMHLGFHVYDVGFQSPNVEAAKPMVYATVLVLLVLVVVLNLAAIALRNRLRRKLRSSAV